MPKKCLQTIHAGRRTVQQAHTKSVLVLAHDLGLEAHGVFDRLRQYTFEVKPRSRRKLELSCRPKQKSSRLAYVADKALQPFPPPPPQQFGAQIDPVAGVRPALAGSEFVNVH